MRKLNKELLDVLTKVTQAYILIFEGEEYMLLIRISWEPTITPVYGLYDLISPGHVRVSCSFNLPIYTIQIIYGA